MSDRKYTGPTGIVDQNNNWHIEGYPDAKRVVKLNTRLGRRIADLRLHQADLQFCERLIQIFWKISSDHPNDISDGLWIAILTKYYSCFGGSKSRSSLDAEKIFRENKDAQKVFKFYQNMRNKNIVHDENNYNRSVTGVVLGEDNEILDILNLLARSMHSLEIDAQNIYNLVSMSLKYVENNIDSCLSKAFSEVRAMSKDEISRMSSLEFVTPSEGDEKKSRAY